MYKRISCRIVLCSLIASISSAAFADPPSHAPAHGWRQKNDPTYADYTGKQAPKFNGISQGWQSDYGVLSGMCQTQEISQAAGAVVGASIGSQIGQGNEQVVATIIGAAVGGWLAGQAAKEFGSIDKACFAQALELGKPGTPVAWSNPIYQYQVTPWNQFNFQGKTCRDVDIYSKSFHTTERAQNQRLKACLVAPGKWEIINP